MNSKIGASFGLAMLMAAGALATMYALGTVLAKDVRADHVTPGAAHLVSMTPSSLDVMFPEPEMEKFPFASANAVLFPIVTFA